MDFDTITYAANSFHRTLLHLVQDRHVRHSADSLMYSASFTSGGMDAHWCYIRSDNGGPAFLSLQGGEPMHFKDGIKLCPLIQVILSETGCYVDIRDIATGEFSRLPYTSSWELLRDTAALVNILGGIRQSLRMAVCLQNWLVARQKQERK